MEGMYEILKEITDWSKASCNVPNHTYLLNDSGKIVAYVKEGTNVVIAFKSGMRLERTYRKFQKVKHEGLSKLIPSQVTPPVVVRRPGVRLFNVKSGNHTYQIEVDANKNYSCSCIGFGYHRKCKHGKAVLEKIS